MRVHYPDELTLREARARYFADNGFGEDGGYSSKWVKLQFGPVPFYFPNTPARVRAVRFHDLHHVVTGYPTTNRGESEIGGYEIGSNCKAFVAAWVLNLMAMGMGLVIAPRAVARAFHRGRRTKNFYGSQFDDALLETTVGEARQRLGLDIDEGSIRPTLADRALLALAYTAGLSLGLAHIAVPVGLLWWWLS